MAKESAAARLVSVPVGDVVIDGRHRKDMGDLTELRQSIAAIGLLHPIVITKDKRLVAGYRRLTAVKQMASASINAVVVENLDDATALLIAERDENTCRKDFTPSEAVAVGKSLEELEGPKAKERQAAHGNTAPGRKKNTCANLPQVSRAPALREKVGAAVGMSGATYQRAKAVVDAAEAEPEKYGPLRDEMDRTGKVSGVYQKLVKAKPSTKRQSKTKKKSPAPRFRDGDFVSLCEQLVDWMQRRADRLGGLEEHAECVQLLTRYQRKVESWQKLKPV